MKIYQINHTYNRKYTYEELFKMGKFYVIGGIILVVAFMLILMLSLCNVTARSDEQSEKDLKTLLENKNQKG